MKVFISWSGARTKTAAEALRRLITDLFDDVHPWVSSYEINAGERWSRVVGEALQESNFGILCCAEDNVLAPWLLFEAGALAKVLDEAQVVPYLVGVDPAELPGPIKQFQGVPATEEGTWELIKSVNRRRPNPRDKETLKRQFDRWWTDMQSALEGLPAADSKFASPMHELLRYAREEAVERAARRGFSVWAAKDGDVEVLNDLLSMPPIDKWSALILDDIIKPLVDFRSAYAEAHFATKALREFLEENPPEETEGGVDLSHASEHTARASKAVKDMKEARSKVRDAFMKYYERFSSEV
ncbi:TIR domain-containing protein [Streptomyces sp. TRM75561]|uniref:TIR domain-containing protein n=1 Tax=Streptomyces sp. TRM75561 TaxID=2975269 RepID=UPI00244C053D|nr:TIR domain-containing protein [Streptomyces sp. TRM75561]MDH3039035.1 TIR domain-containing protein [Streptomyces sp. TRM75561]